MKFHNCHHASLNCFKRVGELFLFHSQKSHLLNLVLEFLIPHKWFSKSSFCQKLFASIEYFVMVMVVLAASVEELIELAFGGAFDNHSFFLDSKFSNEHLLVGFLNKFKEC